MFIVFEGLDGSGKSTQLAILKQALEAKGKNVFVTREPGGTKLGEGIRDLLLHHDMEDYTRALLYAASRYELSKVIKERVDNGDIVLCDRYIFSSLAYQTTNDAEIEEVLNINHFNHGLYVPDYILHFDVTMETYKQRKLARTSERDLDAMESKPDSFFEKNIKQYAHAYEYLEDCYDESEYGKILYIDANHTIEHVTEQVNFMMKKIMKEED